MVNESYFSATRFPSTAYMANPSDPAMVMASPPSDAECTEPTAAKLRRLSERLQLRAREIHRNHHYARQHHAERSHGQRWQIEKPDFCRDEVDRPNHDQNTDARRNRRAARSAARRRGNLHGLRPIALCEP